MAIASKATITIDGKDLKDFLNFQIEQSIYAPHRFEIVCRRDAIETQDGFVVNKAIDQIGAPVTIAVEGVGSSKANFFFKGIITGLYASDNAGNAEIIIRGSSADILMADRPRCRSFTDKTLEQIALEVLTPYPQDLIKTKFSPNNQDSFPYIVQYKENNWDFMRRLAVRFGEWLYYDGSQLIFCPPEKTKVNMTLGVDMSTFDVSLKLDPLNFKYIYYDYLKTTTVQSPSSQVDPSNNLNDTGKRMYEQSKKKYSDEAVSFYPHVNGSETNYPKELDSVVEVEKKGRAVDMTHISGASTVFLKLGNVVAVKAKKVDSSSDTDYGEYLVTSVIHTCDNLANYQNSFTGIPSDAQVPPYTDTNAKPWCEIQSAVVIDSNDPELLGRVKVRFYWMDSNESTPWMRVSNQDAGNNKGIFSVPDIDDEVVVGFEGGDAERPFVMGSFHNSNATPSGQKKDLKDIKYIRSKGGSTIVVDERSGQERIAMFMGGNDLYGIEMNVKEKMIKIMTDQDIYLSGNKITIRAKGTLDIKSDKDVNIKGSSINISGDTTIKGTNVSIQADSKAEMKGATVSVDGSAETEVKGGLVKIN